jgi:heme O synthase-like polyprenyltransferase
MSCQIYDKSLQAYVIIGCGWLKYFSQYCSEKKKKKKDLESFGQSISYLMIINLSCIACNGFNPTIPTVGKNRIQ